MSLADKLATLRKPQPTRIETWIETLDADDRTALIAAATDAEISNSALHRVLREEGCSVGKDSVAQWRASHGFTR